MNQSIKIAPIACAFLLSMSMAQGQATKAVTDVDADFKLAKDLYQKGQISLAYPLFKTLNYNKSATMVKDAPFPTLTQLEAQYYTIVCGLLMNDEVAEKDALTFEQTQYSEPRGQMISYYLAEYYFRKKQFAPAIQYYEKSGYDNMTNDEIAARKFHEGYCYFMQNDLQKAKPFFDAIRQIPSDPNYIDANYYYGFIALGNKNYDEALSSFKIVENEPAYKNVVPYYIMQIYYLQGDQAKAISYGEAAISKSDQYYARDMKQLLGHAYFDRQEFSKALPYLETYVTGTQDASREDIYELSYCYYDNKQYDQAIVGFKQLGGKEDSLAQNSMYLLGDSYLKTGQKANARNAFLFCSLNSNNAEQKRIAQFNYAKLSYELNFPDIALNELRKYITAYPNSADTKEANELLVSILANTNNYQEALGLIQKTGLSSELVQKAYPRVLYGRSVELINDQQLTPASELLTKTLNVPYNQQEKQPAYFWKGEIAYRTGAFDSSVQYLVRYLDNPVTYGDVNPDNAQYDLGYSYLKLQQYAKAATAFQKVVPAKISTNSSPLEQDAYLRLADAYYMQRQYTKAAQMYSNAVDNTLYGADYAYYQRAMIAGAQGKATQKVNYLENFAQRYKNSNLLTDANMETANTYMAQEQFDKAVAPLTAIVNNPNATAIHPKALLDLGVCQYNLNNNTDALKSFQKLISKYPNSDESSDATEYVKSIFVTQGQAAGYVDFMRKNGKEVSYGEADSLTYNTALSAYSNGDFATAAPRLSTYLKQYPNGQSSIEANYQLGWIQNQAKSYDSAYTHFAYVASKAPNKYAELSALEAARIAYFQKKDYTTATTYYTQLKSIATTPENKLESMRGLLRCQYKQEQWTDAAGNAKDLLQQSNIAVDDRQMANMVIAKNLQLNDDPSGAMTAYKAVYAAAKSAYAAEARYRVAEILLSQNKLKDAEKAAFDLINKAGSYDYWITKSYILLGDIYLKEKDLFNAEATLKSVVDNASDANLKAEAQEHLNKVLAEKNK